MCGHYKTDNFCHLLTIFLGFLKEEIAHFRYLEAVDQSTLFVYPRNVFSETFVYFLKIFVIIFFLRYTSLEFLTEWFCIAEKKILESILTVKVNPNPRKILSKEF